MRFCCCAIAVVYICCVCVLYCHTETIYSCATSSDPMILPCQANKIVTGFVKSGSRKTGDNCTHQDGDCFSEHSKITDCVWKSNECIFQIDDIGWSLCPGSIKYIVVEHFECVPVEDIHQICVTPSKELYAPVDNTTANNTRYIISQGFQHGYSHSDFNQSLCSVIIITESGYGIKLWSNYMNINSNDHILIEGKESKFRRTFTEEDPVEVFVQENNVEFSFVFQEVDNGNIGFALRYESFLINNTNASDIIPPEPISTESDTTLTGTTTITKKGSRPTNESDPALLSTWVAIIIATALVVLVLLLIVVAVMVFTHRKRQCKPNGISGINHPDFDGINGSNYDNAGIDDEDDVNDYSSDKIEVLTIPGELL